MKVQTLIITDGRKCGRLYKGVRTHLTSNAVDFYVIWWFFTFKNDQVSRSKITRTDRLTEGHDLLWRCVVASKIVFGVGSFPSFWKPSKEKIGRDEREVGVSKIPSKSLIKDHRLVGSFFFFYVKDCLFVSTIYHLPSIILSVWKKILSHRKFTI